MQKADTIMKQLAAQQGFTLILTDPESIGYVDKSVDITDQVIRILDQAGPQSDTKDVPPPKIAPKK
jgi:outer membrane protein